GGGFCSFRSDARGPCSGTGHGGAPILRRQGIPIVRGAVAATKIIGRVSSSPSPAPCLRALALHFLVRRRPVRRSIGVVGELDRPAPPAVVSRVFPLLENPGLTASEQH